MKDIQFNQELLTEVREGIGWVILNRPAVLNALSLNMIRTLDQLLQTWEADPSLKGIVIEGGGGKAFCAGGDVRAVYEAYKAEDFKTCDGFFREEYTLNARIYTYSKPYISFIDGLAMGGGLGVSVNGSHRIVTEQALLAMPETGIGFFPDVGATTFLTRNFPSVGLYLGLTGTPLKATDALWFGLATHYVPSSLLVPLKDDLKKGMDLETVLSHYHQDPQDKGFLETHQDIIKSHFNKDSLEEIFESLGHDPSPFSQNTLNTLRAKSPTSLAVTFRQLTTKNTVIASEAKKSSNSKKTWIALPPSESLNDNRGGDTKPSLPSFNERMKQEFRLSQHMLENHDFREGIRAVLVDKDRLPRWKPATIEDLMPKDIDHFFSPLGERELVLDEDWK